MGTVGALIYHLPEFYAPNLRGMPCVSRGPGTLLHVVSSRSLFDLLTMSNNRLGLIGHIALPFSIGHLSNVAVRTGAVWTFEVIAENRANRIIRP